MTDVQFLRGYIRPLSLTWWTSMALLCSGLLRAWGVEVPYLTPAVRPIIDALFGSTDPGALITAGLMGIGVRAAIGRRT